MSHKENDTIFNGANVTFETSVNVKNTTVSNVDFYFNGELIKSSTSSPYKIESVLKDFKPGKYKLSAIVNAMDGAKAVHEIDVIFAVKLRDQYQGGYVYRISSDGLHGLIVAPEDLSGGGSSGLL